MGPEEIADKFFLGTSAICTTLIKFIANLKEDSSYIFFYKTRVIPLFKSFNKNKIPACSIIQCI